MGVCARNGRGDKGQHGGGGAGARTKYGTVLGQHVFASHIEHQHGRAVGGVDGDWLAERDGECEGVSGLGCGLVGTDTDHHGLADHAQGVALVAEE